MLIRPDDPVFDAADADPSIDPGDNFYRHVNGGWISANPVPPEYARWAAFEEVRTRNEDLLHHLLDVAAAEGGPPGSPADIVGRYYASGMDEAAIAAAGLDPIRELLDRVLAIDSSGDLLSMLPDLHEIGAGPVFGMAVIPDFDDSTVNLLYLDQSGLGLPERDYYMRDDEGSIALRGQYVEHLANMLALAGLPDAAQAAEAVLVLETAIAGPSYTNTQQRDMDLVINRMTVEALDAHAADLEVPAYLRAIGAGDVTDVNVDNPGFFAAIRGILDAADATTLRAYAASHLLRATASSLPSEFEAEQFRFYGTILGGQQEQKPDR